MTKISDVYFVGLHCDNLSLSLSPWSWFHPAYSKPFPWAPEVPKFIVDVKNYTWKGEIGTKIVDHLPTSFSKGSWEIGPKVGQISLILFVNVRPSVYWICLLDYICVYLNNWVSICFLLLCYNSCIFIVKHLWGKPELSCHYGTSLLALITQSRSEGRAKLFYKWGECDHCSLHTRPHGIRYYWHPIIYPTHTSDDVS